MGDTLLEEILHLEQNLEAELAAERKRAADWLAGRQAALAAATKSRLAPVDGSLLAPERVRQLRRAAATELCHGRMHLRQLVAFAEEGLRVRLRVALSPVIGERRHDRQDGED